MDVWTLPESEKFLVSGLFAKFGCSHFGKLGLSYAFGPKAARKELCYFSADFAPSMLVCVCLADLPKLMHLAFTLLVGYEVGKAARCKKPALIFVLHY